jgi:hypothetical protein
VFDKSPKSEIFQWILEKINYFDFLGIENLCQIFLLKWNWSFGGKFIFCGQERIEHLKKKITESKFMTINQELVKINLSQVGTKNFRFTI